MSRRAYVAGIWVRSCVWKTPRQKRSSKFTADTMTLKTWDNMSKELRQNQRNTLFLGEPCHLVWPFLPMAGMRFMNPTLPWGLWVGPPKVGPPMPATKSTTRFSWPTTPNSPLHKTIVFVTWPCASHEIWYTHSFLLQPWAAISIGLFGWTRLSFYLNIYIYI